MDVTDLDPADLKPSLSDGTDLKPSITTSSYAGGTPSTAVEIKASWLQADGSLNPSLVDQTGSALKPSITKG